MIDLPREEASGALPGALTRPATVGSSTRSVHGCVAMSTLRAGVFEDEDDSCHPSCPGSRLGYRRRGRGPLRRLQADRPSQEIPVFLPGRRYTHCCFPVEPGRLVSSTDQTDSEARDSQNCGHTSHLPVLGGRKGSAAAGPTRRGHVSLLPSSRSLSSQFGCQSWPRSGGTVLGKEKRQVSSSRQASPHRQGMPQRSVCAPGHTPP